MSGLTAFVLAGGKSSRMGADKAFLKFEGRTLLERALALARALTGEVRIVGPREKFAAFGAVVEDVYADRGPLAGIHAALRSSSAELNLMLPVDMPRLKEAFLRHLLAVARASDAVVTVPRLASGWQPLCAVYRRPFADVAEAALEAGKNKVDALFTGVSTRVIEEDELRQFAFDAVMFQNLNTPEDWEQAENGPPRP